MENRTLRARTAGTRLIINADDFGMSTAVNKAILSAFQQELISSTSIMANMSGFEEACEIARDHGLNGKIGVHINLVEGPSLTSPIRQCTRFCNNSGYFIGVPLRRAFRLSSTETPALEQEITAQISACVEQGIEPTHVDSHHHWHTGWGIGSAVMRITRRMGIPAVRINGNFRQHVNLPQKCYQAAYNLILLVRGLAKTRYSYSLSNAIARNTLPPGVVEIVVHPRFDETEALIDLELNENLGTVLEVFRNYQLTSYPA